jgi:hypothetical protein
MKALLMVKQDIERKRSSGVDQESLLFIRKCLTVECRIVSLDKFCGATFNL